MSSKETLHQLIDELPDAEISAAEQFLLGLMRQDAMQHVLDNASEDDEPITPEEEAGAGEAWQEYLRGEALSAEEAKRRLLP